MGNRSWIVSAESEPRVVLTALRHAAAHDVHVLASPQTRDEARLLGDVLAEVAVVRVWVQHGELVEDTVATVSEIAVAVREPVVLAAGTHQAAMLAAAYMHGIPAFAVVRGEPRELPVLPYGYGRQLAEAKLAILEAVRDRPLPLGEVLRVTRLKPAAASYHLHGTGTQPGLLGMRVLTRDTKDRLTLTANGRALVRGIGKR
jgi:hypothetical protein